MKTQYKAFFIQPKPAKRGYYIAHPLTYKFGQILRKAAVVWSWGDVYAKLHTSIPYKEVPIVVRKERA